MNESMNRRVFFRNSTILASGAVLLPSFFSRRAQAAGFSTRLSKALIVDKPTTEVLEKLKSLGYQGVEGGGIGPEEAEKCRALAEQAGMKIHSVIPRGWAEFNHADPAKAQASYDRIVNSMHTAKAFSADAMLLVPGRIGGMKMPEPWDFDIEFDPKNNHLLRVAKGDNTPYEDYIKAHNQAVDASREFIKKLIPIAEQDRVYIAVENVWNNLWVRPAVFKNFVESFQSPWVKVYFDIGNHVKYAPPQEWISTLGKLIVKLHAKDFKVDRAAKSGGQFVNIREGDVNWPLVRQALEQTGYNGFLTIEGGKCTQEEHSQRLDLIIAGK